MKRIVLGLILCGTTALMLGLQVQVHAAFPQSAISVAEAARKNREQKKDQKPVAKVYTNEDLPNLKGSVSVVGSVPAAPPAASTDARPADGTAPAGVATGDKPGAEAAAVTAPAPPVKDEAYWRAAFADARKKLADDTKEADVLQREFNLKQQQYYSDPNQALREQNTRKDLNDTQAQIDTKNADVAKDKAAIANLEDELRKSGGDAGWAR